MIKLFVKQQGWGIIDAGEPTGDVLVLEADISPAVQPLIVGTQVAFEIEPAPRSPTGKRATQVMPLPV